MFDRPKLTKPGLFITGTDTGVGKTVVCCAIVSALRQRAWRAKLGVFKPFATGCRRDRTGLINEDAEALAHFSECPLPMDVINPIRFHAPLAPAVAAEQEGLEVDWSALPRSLTQLDEQCDAVFVEGVGGVMVPLDPKHQRFMVGQLAKLLGYPVLVVCRTGVGTLNHTVMTVEALRQAGCRVSGLVMNGMDFGPESEASDPSVTTNRDWLERLTGVKVLAVLPQGRSVDLHEGQLDSSITAAVSEVDWMELMRVPM